MRLRQLCSRRQVRAIAYKCDLDNANAWLAELLTFHDAAGLAILDETAKDLDCLKGSYGYSIRGTTCSAHDQFLSPASVRVSALVLHTLDEGFLDWAFTQGTFNKDYFIHVTTERFQDWRGGVRAPMLVRFRTFPYHIFPCTLLHCFHSQRSQTSHFFSHKRRTKITCVLLDNASIHHSQEFVHRCGRLGVDVRYIPPYCHFLSTLDNGAFGALVQWLQHHYETVQLLGVEAALEAAFHALNGDGGRLARRCFANCRYI